MNGCMYMSYAQSEWCPEGRTAQPRARSIASQANSRSRLRPCTDVLHFPSSSLSLLATGAEPEEASSRGGSQNRLHSQAFSNSRGQAPGLCIFERPNFKRSSQSCVGDVTQSRIKTWLRSERMANKWPFGLNIALIVCWPKNSLKLMNCWYPNGAGTQNKSMSVARRL
jgi:hypothetical protein